MEKIAKIQATLRNRTLRFILWAIFWIAFLFSMCMSQSGCATVTVNPVSGEVSYMRIGNQSLQGLHVKTHEGWEISFDQESKTEALKTALQIAAALK